MRWKINQQERKLDDLFKLVNEVKDDELKAILAKFLCVRTSGFIESSVKSLINEFIDGASPKSVQNFVNKKMKNVSNLRYDKLVDLLGLFSEDWKLDLISKISDEQKSALNSIVSNRNNIAHGETDTISFGIMKDYYFEAKNLVMLLKGIIKK